MGRELDRVVVLVLEAAEAVVLMSRWKMTYSLAPEKPISFAPSVSLLMEVMNSHAACPSRCLDMLDQRWEDSLQGCTAYQRPRNAVSSPPMGPHVAA